jgi:hypothetical protein
MSAAIYPRRRAGVAPTLGAAIDVARADDPPFGPLFDSATIEHQVYVQAYDHRGQPVEGVGYWKTFETWEVGNNGSVTRTDAEQPTMPT